MWLSRVVVAMAVAVALTGCAEDEPLPVIETLHVRVRANPELETKQLRLALVWADDGSERGITIADDMRAPVDASLALDVRRKIPAGALRTYAQVDGPVARAGIVAYEDTNGNGRLDLTPVSAGNFRDRLRGWAVGWRVLYTPDPDPGSRYARGFNLELDRTVDPWDPQLQVRSPTDTEVELTLLAADETACLGLALQLRSMPQAVRDELLALPPTGTVWPFQRGASVCADNELPADWYRISCSSSDDGSYVITTLAWPSAQTIADQCGWTQAYCRLTLPDDQPRPVEFPSCAR